MRTILAQWSLVGLLSLCMGTAPAEACVVNGDCTDGNQCTADLCIDGVCQFPAQPLGTACASDGVECTTDFCDGTTSPTACIHVAKTFGTACTSDGIDCTNDHCDGSPSPTACIHLSKPFGTSCLSDGIECTLDVCDGSPAPTSCAHFAKPFGTTCSDDGIECTLDLCDGSPSPTSCDHFAQPLGAACSDDGIECTFDVCDGSPAPTSCDHLPKPFGTACSDDGNECTDDICDGSPIPTSCGHTPSSFGTPCDDGTLCTSVDVCDGGGSCDGSTALAVGCRAAGLASLAIKNDADDDAKDKLQFKWSNGDSTALVEFGDPVASTNYALCVFAGGSLVISADVPAAGLCSGLPCWANKTTSFAYKDKLGTNGGIQGAILRESAEDKTKISFKARGATLPTMPLAVPVTVQVVNDSTGVCFESAFTAMDESVNDAGQYKAKVKAP